MSKGVYGAVAMVLLWIAFVSFYVAFHPGGIRSELFVTKDNPDGMARNPANVVMYFVQKLASGTAPKDEGTLT